MLKSLKLDMWEPENRESELSTWREWQFQLSNYLIANDNDYANELKDVDLETGVDHDLMDDAAVARSIKLFTLLTSVVRAPCEEPRGQQEWL